MKEIDKVNVAVYQEAKDGNSCCGDGYFYVETENEFLCALADGLGSGEPAKESSETVIDIIKDNYKDSVEQIVKKANQKLVGKRGVVLGIFKIDFTSKSYSFTSVGNIGLIAVGGDKKRKRNIPNTGYLSGGKKTTKVIHEDIEESMNFVIFSDGVTNEELSNHFYQHENVKDIIQSFKLRKASPRKDDTTLIAIRYNYDPA